MNSPKLADAVNVSQSLTTAELKHGFVFHVASLVFCEIVFEAH